MAWGKEKFRNMYRTSSESLQTISNNYYELDHDYQMLGKALLEIKEYIEKLFNQRIKESKMKQISWDKTLYPDETRYVLDIVNKALKDSDSNE